MTPFIRISDPKAGPDEPHRLNAFPGRYLSEREFELLQEYVDDRIAPLVASEPPGIVNGMEVLSEGSGSNTVLHIQPGVAIGAGGRLTRLYYPQRQKWPEFADLMAQQLDGKLRDGLYFLTLHAVVEEIDKSDNQEPCTRTEPDPTRERRLETVTLPGLQFISDHPRLMSMPQSRAANRICVQFLDQSPHDAKSGAVPIALIKVVNQIPEWIDTVAGRYLSEPDASCRTLLAHTVAQLEQWMEQGNKGNTGTSLAALLGIDYLPAAGPLPPALLANPAGDRPDAGNLPQLMFRPADLQIELAPIPASTVGAAIDRELARGTVDLVHGLGDRIRLLLAIPDTDYRPTLMDLPQRDTALEDELFHREQTATQAWKDWWVQWQLLFGELDKEQCKLNQARFKLDESGQPQPAFDRPVDPNAYRDNLVNERRKTVNDETLPEPYASHQQLPHPAPADYRKADTPVAPAEKLLLQREESRTAIKALDKDLDESYRLLNEMNDYLNLQRQELDSLTVSFSALAGGVAGDGAGSSMMRWNGAVAFDTTQKTEG